MPDAGDIMIDAATTHAVTLLRVSASMRHDALDLLVDLQGELTGRLSKMTTTNLQSRQWASVKRDTDSIIEDTYELLAKNQTKSLSRLADLTAQHSDATINKAFGVKLLTGKIESRMLQALVDEPLVLGAPASQWWMGQADDLRRKFVSEIGKGMLLGETNSQLQKRIVGALPGENDAGTMAKKRREAETLVRTSTISVSNAARLAALEARSDLVKAIVWVAHLDGRTTVICINLNGKMWSLPDYEPIGHDKAFPGSTAHWCCRSTQSAVLKSWEELSGKKLPSLEGDELQKRIAEELRNDGMSEDKIEKYLEHSAEKFSGKKGTLDTFDKWASSKKPEHLDLIVGPGRAALLKAGHLTMEQLTDQNNRPLTLDELQEVIRSGGMPPETLGTKILPSPPAKRADVQKIVSDSIKKAMEGPVIRDEEFEALRRYSESGFDYSSGYIAEYLRRGKTASGMTKDGMISTITKIDAVMNELHLDPQTVWRGSSLGEYGTKLGDVKVGDVLSDRNYTSTSSLKSVASDAYSGGGALMKIKIERKTQGVNMNTEIQGRPFAAITSEREILLPRGSFFIVEKIEGNELTVRLLSDPGEVAIKINK